MSGTPGTPHFGEYSDNQKKDVQELQSGGDNTFRKIHYLFGPERLARAMGSTAGEAPGREIPDVQKESDFFCNHDGFSGGNRNNENMDEQKVLNNFIRASANMECAEDFQNISGTHGDFD